MNRSGSEVSTMSYSLWAFCVILYQTGTLAQGNTRDPEDSYPQKRYFAEDIYCENVTEIVFVGFFPCLRNANFVTSEKLSQCDLLAEAAAYLAIERVNQDPTILANITLRLHPIYIPQSNDSITLHSQFETVTQIFHLLYTPASNKLIWGVIGPDDSPGVTNFVVPIAANSGLLTVSYGARTTNSITERIPTFYRTIPFDFATNVARLVLLVNHKWFRIAILKSNEEQYSEEMSHFIKLFDMYIEMPVFKEIDLELTETFTHEPDSALKKIKSRDINIIFGFFGPDYARRVLCRAKSEDIGLVSPDHAWVLPSYYTPNWWTTHTETGSDSDNCSNQEMSDILESVIFIDNVKYPPVDLTMSKFHSLLLIKTLELFPSLAEEDLKQYLLHSRATSAYDAVTLLAKSVSVAFDQGGDICTNTSMIRRTLDYFMYCEYCQLFSKFSERVDDKNFIFTIKDCDCCQHSALHKSDLGAVQYNGLLHQYGQLLYSQFLDGKECPIVLWWPIFSEKDFNKSYLLIGDFDDEANYIAKSLNLSRGNLVGGNSNCSTHFIWRGSYEPPSSHFLEWSFISIGELVFIGVAVLIGITATLVILIFNIVLRKNRNVKATSPWLNVILLVAIIIRLPTPLYFGLIFSVRYYESLKEIDFTPLCHMSHWQYYIGDTLFAATLIVKNWRIYRIFFNKELEQVAYLSDRMLLVGVMCITLPAVIVLVVWSSLSFHITKDVFQNEYLQIQMITRCTSHAYPVLAGVINVMNSILFLFLLFLSLSTANVPSSTFRRGGLATYKAAVLVILPCPLIYVVRFSLLLSEQGIQYHALIWLEFWWTSVLSAFVVIILFAPSMYSVVKEYFGEKHAITMEAEQRKLTGRFDELKQQINCLKSQLEQTDKAIHRIRMDLSIKNLTIDADITHFSMQVGYSCANETTTDCSTANIRNRVEQFPDIEDKGEVEDTASLNH